MTKCSLLFVNSPHLSPSQRWSAMTLQNETLVLDSSSTTTGSDDMNLVLRQGVLRHKDSYIFTLHVTDGSLDGEGVASITLDRNMPPTGGECHLRGGGEAGVEYGVGDGEGWKLRTLLDRVHFSCSGKKCTKVKSSLLKAISTGCICAKQNETHASLL